MPENALGRNWETTKSGKLSDDAIRNLKPGPKPQKYSDGGGLVLGGTPAGIFNWALLLLLIFC